MGRESVRFELLVERFWYGIAGAVAIVLVLSAVIAWLIRRALLSEVDEISRTASAIEPGVRQALGRALLHLISSRMTMPRCSLENRSNNQPPQFHGQVAADISAYGEKSARFSLR